MAQGNCAVLIVLVFFAACSDARRTTDSDESIAGSAEVQGWLGGFDGDRPVVADKPSVSNVAPVSEMISGLEERLRETPDDLRGWRLLAQSYAFVGNMDRARSAADRAVELGADTEELEATLMNAHAGKTP